MDERKNKMTDERYREILPMAYMAAAIEKGRQPGPIEVGLHVCAIAEAEDEKSPTYRVAMAAKIPAKIVSVEREVTSFGVGRFIISYVADFGDGKVEKIRTPLLNDRHLGKVTDWIWNRYGEDGVNERVGEHMLLYKHNNPPKEGDLSASGYRCVVYAKSLDK